MVSVSGNNKNNRVSVRPVSTNNQVEATNNLAKYYSEISQDWAVGEGLIQNIDYSSKTYALQAKEYANDAKESMEITEEYMDNAISNIQTAETSALNNIVMQEESALSTVNQGVEQLNTTITEGLDNINTSVTEGVETIETTKTEASEYVETTANESIAEVNQAKEQAIKDFNKAFDKVNYLFVMPIGTIGFSPFPIDETKGLRRILNGQLIIQEQFEGFVKWLKENIELYPQMACTEEEWQATVTMSVYGQCGKFVIDDEAGTIRLPRITGFVQGLTDFASLGNLVEAGLPTLKTNSTGAHTHKVTTNTRWGDSQTNNGAYWCGDNGTAGSTSYSLTSTSEGAHTHTIAGTADTVQPEAIRYPYFIQVATGVEETIDTTREIELNNPFFFGYYQYFEVAPNNISWLKSQGQWNDKAVYTDYYDWILTNANNGVVNFKLSTDTYDDYAWVVNTADETFRLPIKTKNAPFTVNGTANVSVYGNGTNPRFYEAGSGEYTYPAQIGVTSYNQSDGSSGAWLYEYGKEKTSFKFSSNPSETGLIGKATVSTSENTNVSLYFYVGETTQNANLINAGRIEEKLVNKVDTNASNFTADGKSLISGWGMASDKYINLTLGASGSSYTAPANGWVVISKKTSAANQSIGLGISNSVRFNVYVPISGGTAEESIPVRKGQSFYCTYSAGGALKFFRFIYAEGEV